MVRFWRTGAVSEPRLGLSAAAVAAPLLGLVTLLLTGCAGMGLPFADIGPERTGSVRTASAGGQSANAVSAVDPSDWEAVRRAVAEAIAARNTDATIEWTNPDTGSSGTISPLLATTASSSSGCRAFATTMSDARGVRHYRGDACRETDGRVRLLRVVADDPALI